MSMRKQQQRYSIQKKYKTAISQFFISCMGGTVIKLPHSSATTTFSAHFSCSILLKIDIFIQIEGCRKHLDLKISTQKLA